MADNDEGRAEGASPVTTDGSVDPGTNSEAGGGEGENAEVITEREKGLQKQVADLETQRDATNSKYDSLLADSKRDEVLSKFADAVNKPKERTQVDRDAEITATVTLINKAIEDEDGGQAIYDLLSNANAELEGIYDAKSQKQMEEMQKALTVLTAKIEGNSPEMVANRAKLETLKEQLGDNHGLTEPQLLNIVMKALPKDQPDRPLAPGTTETVVASATGEESEMSDEQANTISAWLPKGKALSKEERKKLSEKGAVA